MEIIVMASLCNAFLDNIHAFRRVPLVSVFVLYCDDGVMMYVLLQ